MSQSHSFAGHAGQISTGHSSVKIQGIMKELAKSALFFVILLSKQKS